MRVFPESLDICPISGQTLGEERFNFISHLIGLALSILGYGYLIRLGMYTNSWNFVGCLIYGATLMLVYAASTVYHSCQNPTHKRWLQILDHCCIYLLIAGSYTPFTLGPLKNSGGWMICIIEWSLALIGIALKITAFKRFEKLSVVMYLAMGWLAAIHMPYWQEHLNATTLAWMFSGGVAYSVGVLFYLWHKLPFGHGIWHLFVLTGSFCHYCSIWEMVQAITLMT